MKKSIIILFDARYVKEVHIAGAAEALRDNGFAPVCIPVLHLQDKLRVVNLGDLTVEEFEKVKREIREMVPVLEVQP
jgi:hypothetical protein